MIVAKALEVIDRDGLEALSVRRIARDLGVTVGAMYHHITGKEDLLLEVTRALLRDLRIPEGKPVSGRDALVEFARAYRVAIIAHPNAAPLLVDRPWRSYAHPHIERLLEVLDGHGVEFDLRLILFQSLEMLAFSSAVFSPIPDIDAYGEVGDQFPLLRETLNSKTWTPDETFEIVLNALLAGFGIALAPPPADGARRTNERR